MSDKTPEDRDPRDIQRDAELAAARLLDTPALRDLIAKTVRALGEDIHNAATDDWNAIGARIEALRALEVMLIFRQDAADAVFGVPDAATWRYQELVEALEDPEAETGPDELWLEILAEVQALKKQYPDLPPYPPVVGAP
jgi:hypothetical protein